MRRKHSIFTLLSVLPVSSFGYFDGFKTDSRAKNLLRIFLHRLAGSLQLSLDAYYDFVEEYPVSKQAFSKARSNLNPDYVRKFADGIAEIHANSPDAPTYLGMRLIAIDGTDIALENSPALKAAFGCSGPQNNAATALGSLAYGPLDHAISDFQLAPYVTDERELAEIHMNRLTQLGLKGSLLLFDRWYPSKKFIAHTINAGFFFVMRVREKWNLDVDRIKTQGDVVLRHDGQEFSVRVLKVLLSSGETETLLTNLDSQSYRLAMLRICISSVGALKQPMIYSNPSFSWRISPAGQRSACSKISTPLSIWLVWPPPAPRKPMC